MICNQSYLCYSAGRCRTSRRHGNVRCRSQSHSNPDFGLGPRFRPLDSIDYEWRVSKRRLSALHHAAQNHSNCSNLFGVHIGFNSRHISAAQVLFDHMQALNQNRAQAKFSSAHGAGIWLQGDVTTWDMIDFSEISSDTSATRCSGDVKAPCKDRLWQHGLASKTNYWDEYGRVSSLHFAFTACILGQDQSL